MPSPPVPSSFCSIERPGRTVVVDELRRETPIGVEHGTLNDVVLLKSDGMPTYHLASVVDDAEMGITDVVRGDEWLPSLPIHVLIGQALDVPIPRYFHLPLLLAGKGKGKLSKRRQDAAVEHFLSTQGVLPSALLNFVALLGWNPGTTQEIYRDLAALEEAFDIARVHKSPAVVDVERLAWMNREHIMLRCREESDVGRREVWRLAVARPDAPEWLRNVDEEQGIDALATVANKLGRAIFTVDDVPAETAVLLTEPDAAECVVERPGDRQAIAQLVEQLRGAPNDAADMAALLKPHRKSMPAIRRALTGQRSGADLSKLMAVLGVGTCLERLARVA